MDGKEAAVLGQGYWKIALQHPANPAWTVKLHLSRVTGYPGAAKRADVERETLGLSAKTRAGPRFVAEGKVRMKADQLSSWIKDWRALRIDEAHRMAVGASKGLYYYVEERVQGKGLPGKLTPEQVVSVWTLFQRLTAAGVQFWDYHKGNIFWGTTASDPRPRAYIVDAGALKKSKLAAETLKTEHREVLDTYTGEYPAWRETPELAQQGM